MLIGTLPIITGGLLMIVLDLHLNTQFYDASFNGDPPEKRARADISLSCEHGAQKATKTRYHNPTRLNVRSTSTRK